MPVADVSAGWPFELVEQSEYLALTTAERYKAQVRMQDEIDTILAARKANGTQGP